MADREFDFAVGAKAQYQAIGFNAYSVQIDNNTNQWLLVADVGVYISPYTIGVVYPLHGTSTASFSYTAKPGTQQAATIAGEVATVTYYDYEQQASSGQTTVVRAPSTEWRNPLTKVFYSSSSIAGPQAGAVGLFTYTVPAGRRAQVDTAQVVNELQVSDGSGAGVNVEADIIYQPLGVGSANFLINGIIHTGTIKGARADVALPRIKELTAGDLVQAQQQNQRGAGVTQFWLIAMTITEGDA